MYVRLRQLLNALAPIVVTLLDIFTDASLLQPENALAPIVVTLLGIVIDVKFLQL